MKHQINFLALITLLVSLAGCAVTDIDRTADFSRYRTFAWGEPEVKVDNPLHTGDLIDKKIRSAVEEQFAKRGIVVNKTRPDFIVSYKIHTAEKQQTTGGTMAYRPFLGPYFYPFGWGWGWGGWWYPLGMVGTLPRTYTVTEGTLVVDVTDAKTDQLVWRGSVTGNINDTSSLQKQIDKAVKAILKKYPASKDEPLPLPSATPIS